MALNIKNAEVVEAIRRLAKELEVDLTEAIRVAVVGELTRRTSDSSKQLRKMRSIADMIISMPVLDHRSANEILSYDEIGLPS